SVLDPTETTRHSFSAWSHTFPLYSFPLGFRVATSKMEENLDAAVDSILNVEKQMRLAGDVAGTRKAVIDILELCYKARAWKTLNDQIVLLSKRRGQLKQAVTAMVQKAMQYIDDTPDIETRIELIKTLNNVSAGKIYVEIERARLIKKLAKIKEEQGLISEAADLMQEIAVETFGAMAKTEKIAFILDQVRLCLDRQDYVQAQILSRKISPRVFDADASKGKKKPKEGDNVVEEAPADIPSLLELKRIYYELMIRLLLKQLVTMEVIHWASLWEMYKVEFENEKNLLGGSLGTKAEEDLKLRIIEHNILVVSRYYSRITLKRLADLLCLSLQEAEKYLSDMVVSKALAAKIDRPIGIVSFQTAKGSNDILNSWAMNLEKLLDLVEKSCHQIHKETMVHKAVLRA
ncbi:26S proteasome non-atpase regulatory subunit, partial [Musa troglodytarum]